MKDWVLKIFFEEKIVLYDLDKTCQFSNCFKNGCQILRLTLDLVGVYGFDYIVIFLYLFNSIKNVYLKKKYLISIAKISCYIPEKTVTNVWCMFI